ncbi:Exonuclease, RNase T/DNA polymerase III [Penicillium italicum]|uniref:Exonuclease, RNase T/DNA polymerase III n=1 Tax=Penicillium italicum TaxID=40296 RepID=A0A0A2LB97_PENIT|nr:Exonuclease, RNase T/DNA polymerase III [Penicillium italicum]
MVVYQAASQFYQAPAQGFQPPTFQTPARVFQLPAEVPQVAIPRVHQPPSQVYQTPNRRNENQVLVQRSRVQTSQFPVEDSQSQQRASQSSVQDSHQAEVPRPLVQDTQQAKVSPSLEHSLSSVQDSQSLEAPQSPVQDTRCAVQTPDQIDQASQSSLQLSAQDGTTAETNGRDTTTPSTPATNTTTASLFIPPTTSNPTFSLVYHKTKHRWTDLEPLEQTLILKYLLGRCHTQQRLHCQGYNAPKTIDTTSCLKRGEPHQAHTFTRHSTHRKAIVIDCEMIETTLCTSELAFITAIDFLTGEVLINSFVAPTAPVTNWLTPISGITPEKMDVAIADDRAFKSNHDARRALQMFLDRDTVLIGHALHHDLRTLGLVHGRIVDTSVVTAEAVFSNFSAKTVLPRVWGLKALAWELIGIEIQTGDEGHNSLEDALATREVLIWCLRGPECLKFWAEKTRSLYEQMKQQRGGQKKTVRNTPKKVRGHTPAKGRGKKKPVAD